MAANPGRCLVNDRGIELPERFTHPQEEYQAVREKAGLINLSFRSQIRMTGEDRVAFLQGMVSTMSKPSNLEMAALRLC